jgi:hypothetical protein
MEKGEKKISKEDKKIAKEDKKIAKEEKKIVKEDKQMDDKKEEKKEKTEQDNKVDVSDFEMSDTKQTAEKEHAKSQELMKQATHALDTDAKEKTQLKEKIDEDMSITQVAKVLHADSDSDHPAKKEKKAQAPAKTAQPSIQ